MRVRVLTLQLAMAIVAGVTGAAVPVVEFSPVEGAAADPISVAKSDRAQGLEVRSECHQTVPRAARVELRWQLPADRASEGVRIDISKLREGFATGRYLASDELAADTMAVAIVGPEPGVNYYWRVVDKAGDGWVTAGTARFKVPVCPWDEPRGPGTEPPPTTVETTARGGRS